MENLYISRSVLNKKNHFLTSGFKTIYINPYNSSELIVTLGSKEHNLFDEHNDHIVERLEELYLLSDSSICKNINLPLGKVYLDNVYGAYLLPRIMDPCDFSNICNTLEITLDTKLEILKRMDDTVKNMHKMGIVSGDLNPTNLLLDGNLGGCVIDLIDSQFKNFLIVASDNRLSELYGKTFYMKHLPHNIDNVSMHLNLMLALADTDEFSIMTYEQRKRLVKTLKLPNQVKETFYRLGEFTDMETIPYVSDTIKQIL